MKTAELDELKLLLDEKYQQYAHPNFIENDPIQIPHQFSKKEDIEISAFLTSIIAWGKRKMIIDNANKLMQIMGKTPYDFILNHSQKDLDSIQFVHRTFQTADFIYFVKALNRIYSNYGGLEQVFAKNIKLGMKDNLAKFHQFFLSFDCLDRTIKHIANPAKNSSAKRINMFLRWMVRPNKEGVDFGIWKSINAADLYCPLDVHTGNVGRHLGLINRKANDWKALEELMTNLRQFDAKDPVKYDFALFGMGVNSV